MIREMKTLLLLMLTVVLVTVPVTFTQAEEELPIPDRNALSDGKLTEEEIKQYATLAAVHVQKLTTVAREEVGAELEQSGIVIPSAWMMMNDGEVKRVKLGETGDKASATIKVLMYRAALKSLARHGKILGTAIVYAGNLDGEDDIRVLAVEHEHRLGISGLQIVPYRFQQGELSFGDAQSQKKPYELFYDGATES
ncbi:hypothetical protein DOQ08_00875 [Marinobacter litoralis]|uniref:Uncharacterized protein n=1 Tax=Marinobacter litoralis TaxID=187981 RepID=A0A3M2RLH4_9GAMM|nr:hypothetical protein [Marinobacter litoralis]RMJ06190.1 hypothetical protein DOQ08_00875 [Marinobacter litoralis]